MRLILFSQSLSLVSALVSMNDKLAINSILFPVVSYIISISTIAISDRGTGKLSNQILQDFLLIARM